jgi:hypothetical protein
LLTRFYSTPFQGIGYEVFSDDLEKGELCADLQKTLNELLLEIVYLENMNKTLEIVYHL